MTTLTERGKAITTLVAIYVTAMVLFMAVPGVQEFTTWAWRTVHGAIT
jgi:hypothetical protein